jgi:penicillin-binding protein-related factor A (putative recombinase)
MSPRMKGGALKAWRMCVCVCVFQGMSKKENETNETNQIFNFPISQFQIHILKFLKMVGWIG